MSISHNPNAGNSEIRIRRATDNDLETVIAFNIAMARETEGKTLDRATVSAGVATALADSDRCMYYVAEVGGNLAGQTMVTTEWSDWRNGLFWWIQSVYVEPAFRRAGVFRSLYEHIRGLARETKGVCGLRLYVHRTNQRAIDTYANLGMSLTEYVLCEEDWPTA